MRPAFQFRAAGVLALALAVTVGLLGCRDRAAPEGAATDPQGRLSQLLRRGAEPGELSVGEREEVERLLVPLLPATEGSSRATAGAWPTTTCRTATS